MYPVLPLGEVVDFLDHKRRPVKQSDRIDGPYPYYGANGLQGSIDSFIFDEPLVLVAEDGGHFDDPERGIAYQISGKTWVNNHAHVLRPGPKVDIRFLTRVLENYDVRPFISGTTRGKLTKGQAEKIEIPLPPLEEQKRIAAILDQADALRRLRARALDRLNALGQAIFHEMFGDPFSDQKANQVVDLESLTTRITYGFTSPMSHHDSGIPILTAKSVRDGFIDYSSCNYAVQNEFDALSAKSKPDRGDILITKDGTIGRYAVFDDDFPVAINQSVALVKPDQRRVVPEYLAAYFGSAGVQARFQAMKKGNALPHLQITELAKFPIFSPPLAEQIVMKERVQQVMKMSVPIGKSTNDLETLFSSLQQRAFRGEL
jgi:type I restriction enzyme S subunit